VNFSFVEDPDFFEGMSEKANPATQGRIQEDLKLQLEAKCNGNVITYWNTLD
jgi:hypothetical protein